MHLNRKGFDVNIYGYAGFCCLLRQGRHNLAYVNSYEKKREGACYPTKNSYSNPKGDKSKFLGIAFKIAVPRDVWIFRTGI